MTPVLQLVWVAALLPLEPQLQTNTLVREYESKMFQSIFNFTSFSLVYSQLLMRHVLQTMLQNPQEGAGNYELTVVLDG